MPNKYQQEIEEILRRAGEVPPVETTRATETASGNAARVPSPSRQARHSGGRPSKQWRAPSLSSGKIALVGLLLLLVGALWEVLLLWVGLGLLVIAYLLFFVKPRSSSYEPRWRGRPLRERPSAWERFKSWLTS